MGIRDWGKRQPKRAVDFGKKVVAADQLKEGGQYIADLKNSLKTDSRRQETFENAKRRLNLNEQDIASSYKLYTFRFNMFLFFSILALVVGGYFAVSGRATALAFVGFLAIAVSQLFNASFRLMQIRYRELLPISFWLNNPKEWWLKPLPVAKGTSQQLVQKQKSTSIKKK